MNVTELFSNLTVDDSNVDVILSSMISDPFRFSKAIRSGLHAIDTIVDFNLRKRALSILASSCIELYKWFLPFSDGILSKDYHAIKDKYLNYDEDIQQMAKSLTEVCHCFNTASPTRKCSLASIARSILSELTPKLDAWSGAEWDRE